MIVARGTGPQASTSVNKHPGGRRSESPDIGVRLQQRVDGEFGSRASVPEHLPATNPGRGVDGVDLHLLASQFR